MDSRTRSVYADQAGAWIERRGGPRPRALRRLARFAKRVEPGGLVADLGSGPGWYAASLQRRGFRAVALDASREMLRALPGRRGGERRVQADLAALPFARGSLQGAWAINCLQHLPIGELCVSLARLHDCLQSGAPIEFTLPDLSAARQRAIRARDGVGHWRIEGFMAGRLFTGLSPQRATALLERVGFEDVAVDPARGDQFWMWVRGRRRFTLPDYVRPDLDVLVCGLNPSLYAADTGIPFGRPGNRFWPAAHGAGLCARPFDPWDAVAHGLGFTDLVKRPTRSAAELTRAEYAEGIEALRACVSWARPRAVCLVGLGGWRHAVDRDAQPGWITEGIAGRPAYLMPSTSGLNARASLDTLTRHLRRVRRSAR